MTTYYLIIIDICVLLLLISVFIIIDICVYYY